jgi:hypothetical protein
MLEYSSATTRVNGNRDKLQLGIRLSELVSGIERTMLAAILVLCPTMTTADRK